MGKLIRREKGSLVFYRNRGGFLAFLGQCDHPSRFNEYGVDYVDMGICLQSCPKKPQCRDFWNRKERIKKSQELNYATINPEIIKKELNG